MKIIIHDLNQKEFTALNLKIDENSTVISDNGTIHHCIGCFGCWIKTPGVCVLKDDYRNMGKLLSKCSELVIISKCLYGSYSPFIRNIFDRSIPYLLPYFVLKNKETHHKKRYKNKITLSVHFYGTDINDAEKKTAKALVKANGINLYCSENKVFFHENQQVIRERKFL